MHIIKNQSSMFCSNVFIAFLFFTLHSSFAEAKSSCQGEDDKTVPCHNMNAKDNGLRSPLMTNSLSTHYTIQAVFYTTNHPWAELVRLHKR